MPPVTTAPAAGLESVAGVELEVLRRGTGNPLLLLHGFQHIDPRLPVVDLLGRDERPKPGCDGAMSSASRASRSTTGSRGSMC